MVDGSKETVSSRHNSTDSHVNLQRLQRNAQARTRENLSTEKGKQTCIWVQGLYYQFAFFFFFSWLLVVFVC